MRWAAVEIGPKIHNRLAFEPSVLNEVSMIDPSPSLQWKKPESFNMTSHTLYCHDSRRHIHYTTMIPGVLAYFLRHMKSWRISIALRSSPGHCQAPEVQRQRCLARVGMTPEKLEPWLCKRCLTLRLQVYDRFVGVLSIRALLFRAHIGAP